MKVPTSRSWVALLGLALVGLGCGSDAAPTGDDAGDDGTEEAQTTNPEGAVPSDARTPDDAPGSMQADASLADAEPDSTTEPDGADEVGDSAAPDARTPDADAALEPDAQRFDAQSDAPVEAEAPIPDAGADSTATGAGDASSQDGGTAADASLDGATGGGGPVVLGPCGVAPPAGVAASAVLVDLGAVNTIAGVVQIGSRALSTDSGRWILWDSATREQVATGLGSALSAAGSVFVASGASHAEVRSLSDGGLVGTLPVPSASLSADGSYAWHSDGAGITAWSLTGASLLSHAGDYSVTSASDSLGPQLLIVAAPDELRVARGPAGNDVVEYFAVSSGAESVQPFAGSFRTWAFDGTNFYTTEASPDASAQETVRVYGAHATLLATDVLTSTSDLAGMAGYYWTATGQVSLASDPNYLGPVGPVTVYFPNVSEQTVAWSSSVAPATGQTIETIRRFRGGNSSEDVTLPPGFDADRPFSAAATSWAAGGSRGLLYEGAGGYLGCGQAIDVAGSSAGTVAVSTAMGDVLVFDSATRTLVSRVQGGYGAVSLSSAGTVLAGADATRVRSFTVPGLSPLPSFQAARFSLASGGTALGYGEGTTAATCSRAVALLSGADAGASLFADTGRCPVPLVSPSGGRFAATNLYPSASSMTFLAEGTSFVAGVPGYAKGWIDDDHLLVQTYTNATVPNDASYGAGAYAGTVIYDHQGNALSTPALPELDTFVPVSGGRIFWPSGDSLFDQITGSLVAGGGTYLGTTSGITATYRVEPQHAITASPFPWGVLLTPY